MALSEDSAGLASSLTDLMTSLAVIFILLLVVSLNNAQEKIREGQQQTVTTRNAILVALQNALNVFSPQGVRVEADPKDPLGLLIIVPEGLLEFAINKAEIPQGGIDFLREFIPKLAATVCSSTFKNEINSIVVEGHTDPSGTDEINLPLSQNRSMAVVRESLRILGGPDPDLSSHRPCFLTFLAASGRGSAEPITIKVTTEDKERGPEWIDYPRSRRVVFKIRVRSLEQRQEVLERLLPSQPLSTQ